MENHCIEIENKKRICVTEVTSVEAFDEETILTNLREEGLIISGKNLHIEALDLEEGKLVAEGEIESLSYTKKKTEKEFLTDSAGSRDDGADSKRALSGFHHVLLWSGCNDRLFCERQCDSAVQKQQKALRCHLSQLLSVRSLSVQSVSVQRISRRAHFLRNSFLRRRDFIVEKRNLWYTVS